MNQLLVERVGEHSFIPLNDTAAKLLNDVGATQFTPSMIDTCREHGYEVQCINKETNNNG